MWFVQSCWATDVRDGGHILETQSGEPPPPPPPPPLRLLQLSSSLFNKLLVANW